MKVDGGEGGGGGVGPRNLKCEPALCCVQCHSFINETNGILCYYQLIKVGVNFEKKKSYSLLTAKVGRMCIIENAQHNLLLPRAISLELFVRATDHLLLRHPYQIVK